MEEGMTKRFLLVEETNGGSAASYSSAITASLLLGTFVASCGQFAYGCAAGYSSPAEIGIMEDFSLSSAEYSVFASIATIGGMLGAAVSGKITDLIGRRRAMWFCDIFCTIGWLSIIFAEGVWMLDVGRFLLGFGLGNQVYVTCVYTAEIAPKNIRGGFTAFNMDYTQTFEQLSKASILNLFDRRYAHPLTIGVGIMFLLQFGGNCGILFYASSIFEAAGCSATVGTTTMAIIQLPSAVLGVFLMDRSGRRPLLMVCAAGTCLGNIVAGLAFLLQDLHYPKELSAIFVLSGILVYTAFYTVGMTNTPWVLMSEIFPINIRGSAGSLVTFASCFSAWIVSYSFNFFFERSSAGVFFIFATICGSTVLFVAKLVPETKCRSLEEIQASMTHILD